MAKSVDLNKLKTEIDSRKRERNMTQSPLGESVGAGVAPRDVFLNGLLESLRTGKENAATSLVKVVDGRVAEKKGESLRMRINETPVAQPQRGHIPMPAQDVDMSPERDEQLYRDMESKRKQTLTESMSEFSKMPAVGAPMKNQPPAQPMNLNEQYLTENVKKIVNNYLAESLSPIFEEAIKDTILEMYAVDRIKSVLTENKDLIRTIVIETIREIQAKSKQNKAQQ
jgi:hypothetical protein